MGENLYNFLFCFDSNFNTQALVSINSLLNKVSMPINIYIIHDDKKTILQNIKLIESNKNLNNVYIYQFNDKVTPLPEIRTHISKATYFRLFISEYLPKDLDFILYLDSDIICLNDPIKELELIKEKMILENSVIAARIETKRDRNPELFERLKLKDNSYFNAGVLLINFQKWEKKDISAKIFNTLNSKFKEIFDYDQELLNICFDGDFIKLPKSLNFQATGTQSKNDLDTLKKTIYFYHYLGKDKPWEIKNINKPSTYIYQNEYQKLFRDNFHLVFKKNKEEFKTILKLTISFFSFKNKYLYLILKLAIKNFIKK